MELSTFFLLGGFAVFVGVLIGCVGIGGVLLVPILTYIFRIDIHIAIAAAMFSYMFSGVIGTLIYAKKGSIKWPQTIWLFIGAAPAAFVGAKVTLSIPGQYLEFLIALFVVAAGINAMRNQKSKEGSLNITNPFALLSIGVVTGIGSALTGTGGPLFIVPIMVSLKVAAHTAIGFGQAIQLPIASLATIGNFLYGSVDLIVGGVIAGGIIIGSTFGAKLAHLFSSAIMNRILALVLVTVGMIMIGRVFWYLPYKSLTWL
ncbi:MAG TPA: sulfite exporter TauE/SafE family protein [Rhodospirillales bacterium]|nr:sulfite exporter TauE/SafE family protein [Rhodospirillales bacterium]